MADEKGTVNKPEPAKKKKTEKSSNELLEQLRDPTMVKYNALLTSREDKKVTEVSLLITLCFLIVMTFVVFPDLASQLLEADREEDVIEVPKQTIIQQEEPPQKKEEVRRVEEQRERDFNQIPDITRPTSDMEIIEDIPMEKLAVEQETFDDLLLGGPPSAAPGPVEIAGNIQKPTFTVSGPQPFPQKAKILRRPGVVTVRLIVRKNGSYEIVEFLKEDPPGFGFKEACEQYLSQFKWSAATQNGRPIDVFYNITINFQL